MSAWLILPGVILVVVVGIGLGEWLRHRRRIDTPVSDQWRAEHDYTKDGDRGK
jgi:hypothetical protein